ncbi:ATP-binding protein [Fluviibacterium sp. DFM31]|uniref:histidine kinase n=1 Tax=Meridianimarinicoccus marinus TaxID=3231483 RepID=A0ABV3L1K7_9RHOB
MARIAGLSQHGLDGVLSYHHKERVAFGLALGLTALGILVASGTPRVLLLAAGLGAGVALVIVKLAEGLRGRVARAELNRVSQFFARDAAVWVVTDFSGRVLRCNAAARAELGLTKGQMLSDKLDRLFAAPVRRVAELLDRARATGSSALDRASHSGKVRLAATLAPGNLVVWRLENLTSRSASVGRGEVGLPVLVVCPDGRVLGQNTAMTELLGREVTVVDEAFGKRPLVSGGMCQLNAESGRTQVRVVVVDDDDTGCREVFILPENLDDAADARKLFESLPVPMLKLSIDGKIIWANQGARSLLGREVPPSTHFNDLVSGLGRPLGDWLRDASSGGGLSQSEFLQVRCDDSHRFVQVSLKAADELGEPALLAVLSDATELKTLEAQFVQSQKMQAIGQLAGGVAHDFNNLLTAISGHCDLLLLRHDEGDPDYGDLIQINQNANRAASLVGQLLAFSRKQTLRPEVVDLRDALSDLTHLLSRLVGERVRLTLKHDDKVPAIRADKRQLEQVIMNLVVNARDAMPEGGEILVQTSAVTLETELCRNRAVIPAGSYAVVSVQDEGSGIPSSQLQKVFEPFFTTKKTGEGTGLGLSTAYGIIKQSGGFIFADSTPGVSTVFTIYFPAFTETQVLPAPVVKEAKPAPETHRDGVVLLVEDEAPVRAFASRALQLRGLTVIEAESAEEALELLEDPDLDVDVFVTDVVMPGMDGPNWVRRALQERPDTRVIFVSGYAEDALSDHETKIPNSVFLPKPFSLEALTSTVQAQLH